MSEQPHRVVVGLRATAWSSESTRPREEALRALVADIARQGARLVAWLPPLVVCDFPRENLDAAIELARAAASSGRFGVGIAEGRVRSILEQAGRFAVVIGRALREAERLARQARPGEALIERRARLVRERRVLLSGKRYRTNRGRVECVGVLDLQNSARLPFAESLGRLSPSAWVGVPPEQAADLAPAHLTVLHAPPGSGATRFFRELEGARPFLRLGPGLAGEPLGALRRAFARMPDTSARVQREPGLSSSMERLLGGAGLRPTEAVALLLGWTRIAGRDPVIFVEEPQRVDRESLEALLVGGGDAAVLVRSRDGGVPPGFQRLPVHAEIGLNCISEEEAIVAIESMVEASLEPVVAARYAKRGGCLPLGISEAIADSLECGELVWVDGKLRPRGRIAGRGRPRTPAYWIARRLERLEPQERELLEALAILGGEAEATDLAWLAERGAVPVQLGPLTRTLNAVRLLRRSGDRMVALSSDTLRRRSMAVMQPRRRAELHRLISELCENAERPLLAGAAAVHAFLAGDPQRAAELGRKMALLCRVNQLEDSAAVFERFASRGDFGVLMAHRLSGFWTANDVVDLPPDTPRMTHPVPSASRVAERSKRSASIAPSSPVSPSSDATTPRALGGEGRLAQVLARLEAASTSSVGRGRKLLAEALWCARAGDDVESLLWCLEALAEARRSQDPRGERASLVLAVALSRKAGEMRACAAWQARLDTLV